MQPIISQGEAYLIGVWEKAGRIKIIPDMGRKESVTVLGASFFSLVLLGWNMPLNSNNVVCVEVREGCVGVCACVCKVT